MQDKPKLNLKVDFLTEDEMDAFYMRYAEERARDIALKDNINIDKLFADLIEAETSLMNLTNAYISLFQIPALNRSFTSLGVKRKNIVKTYIKEDVLKAIAKTDENGHYQEFFEAEE